MELNDLLALLRERGGTRQTTIRVLGKDVQSDDVVYQQETVEIEDENGIRTIQWHDTRLCNSCGHAIDQHNALAGVCKVCDRMVCSAEGCAYRCQWCGILLCRRHARVYGSKKEKKDQIYCRYHSYIYWLKKIFL